jgi:hypothetical protein
VDADLQSRLKNPRDTRQTKSFVVKGEDTLDEALFTCYLDRFVTSCESWLSRDLNHGVTVATAMVTVCISRVSLQFLACLHSIKPSIWTLVATARSRNPNVEAFAGS